MNHKRLLVLFVCGIVCTLSLIALLQAKTCECIEPGKELEGCMKGEFHSIKKVSGTCDSFNACRATIECWCWDFDLKKTYVGKVYNSYQPCGDCAKKDTGGGGGVGDRGGIGWTPDPEDMLFSAGGKL